MDYKVAIINCFTELSERERNYWGGYSTFLRLYDQARGIERWELIKAMGELIEESEDIGLVSDLVYLADVMDIAVDESVERLRVSGRFGSSQVIKEVTEGYQAMVVFKKREFELPKEFKRGQEAMEVRERFVKEWFREPHIRYLSGIYLGKDPQGFYLDLRLRENLPEGISLPEVFEGLRVKLLNI